MMISDRLEVIVPPHLIINLYPTNTNDLIIVKPDYYFSRDLSLLLSSLRYWLAAAGDEFN